MTARALTPELKAEICARIADGETVRQIAKVEGMPAKSTIFAEMRRDPDFAQEYALAREQQLECWEDELVEIADDVSRDVVKRADGSEVVDHEHINRAKLRVNTRQWIMSKRLPRRYGDRVAQEVSGPDGGPVEIKETTIVESARRVAFLMATGRELARKDQK